MAPGGPLQSGTDPSDSVFAEEARFARLLLQQRRRREQALGSEHFADPVWDMMLDLFVARVAGEDVAMSSLVIGANVPQSTALRRIRMLVRQGGFIARADPHDGRRTFIALSDALFEALAVLLRAWRDAAALMLGGD